MATRVGSCDICGRASCNDCDCQLTRSCYVHKLYHLKLEDDSKKFKSLPIQKLFQHIPSLSQTEASTITSSQLSQVFYNDFGMPIEAHPTTIVQVSVSIRKKLFATFCLDSHIRIWDSETLELKYIKLIDIKIKRFIMKKIKFIRLASYADLVLCLCEDRNLIIWDYKNDTIREFKNYILEISLVKFLNFDQDFVIFEDHNKVMIINKTDFKVFRFFKLDRVILKDCGDNMIWFIAPDIELNCGIDVNLFNRLLKTSANNDKKFAVYVYESNENIVKLYLKCKLLDPVILKVAHDSRLVSIVYKNNTIEIFDPYLSSSKYINFGLDFVKQINYSFEYTKLFILDNNFMLHLWNIDLNILEKSYSLINEKILNNFFLLDETKAGIYDELNDLYSIDFINMGINYIQGHTNRVSVIETDFKGTFFTGGHDRSLFIWNTNNKKTLIKKQAHDLCVTSLGISINSNTVISGGLDAKIKIWNISNFDLIKEIYENNLKINQIIVYDQYAVADSDDLIFVCFDLKKLNSIHRLFRVENEEKIFTLTANKKYMLLINFFLLFNQYA